MARWRLTDPWGLGPLPRLQAGPKQFSRLLGQAVGSVVPNRPVGSRATSSATTTVGFAYGGGTILPSGAPTGGMDAGVGLFPPLSQLPTQVAAVLWDNPNWHGSRHSLLPLVSQPPCGGGLPLPAVGTAVGIPYCRWLPNCPMAVGCHCQPRLACSLHCFSCLHRWLQCRGTIPAGAAVGIPYCRGLPNRLARVGCHCQQWVPLFPTGAG